MHHGQRCTDFPVEAKNQLNMVTLSQHQEVFIDQLIIDRICNIFADELANRWKVLGRRWALSILKNLDTKVAIRFNQLPGISSTVLADRLSQFVREGLISKKIYPEIPPKVEYSLTVQAMGLQVIFKELRRWTQRSNPHRNSAIEVPVTNGIKSLSKSVSQLVVDNRA
jgi:DNA-binding HxlR family transcriptional regulator